MIPKTTDDIFAHKNMNKKYTKIMKKENIRYMGNGYIYIIRSKEEIKNYFFFYRFENEKHILVIHNMVEFYRQ